MNIHFVCSIELGLNSGNALQVAEYAMNLVALGNDVTLFAPRYSYRGAIEGVDLVSIPCGHSLYSSKILYQLLLLPVLVWKMLARRPDCLLVKHSIANLGFIAPALFFRVPFVLQVDAEPIEEMMVLGRHIPSAYLALFDRFQTYAFARADSIIVVHPAVKRQLVARYRLPKDQVKAIRLGVDTRLFRPMDQAESRRILGLDPNLRYLTFVGHVQPWHGVDYVIEAVPYLSRLRDDFAVLIVGDGPSLSNAVVLAEARGVENRVRFIGEVPRTEVPLWLSASDVCLLPAKMVRQHPGDPIKMYEYAACGRPILAADVEGYGDFVEANGLGVRVDYRDSIQVAGAMDVLLSQDLSRYREHNREVAVDGHQWKHTVEQVNRILSASLRA